MLWTGPNSTVHLSLCISYHEEEASRRHRLKQLVWSSKCLTVAVLTKCVAIVTKTAKYVYGHLLYVCFN